ncbi:MAG: imidazole glycerol phosphate synthase subunit HisH [Campylobacterales bacterium]|nr:imidazole glycerol phosphate synthase subunit HisH [Campylobacterales bacterium]
MIGIINYNMGNLASVMNAFEKIGVSAKIENDSKNLKNYDKLILPGVGAFGDAMSHLKEYGLDEAIVEYTKSGKEILGICLGMQLLFSTSQEFGNHEGLNLIDGDVVLFDKSKFEHSLKVPHMGWNELFVKESKLFKELPSEPYLYFVHSYHVVCEEKYAIAKTNYGYEFVSAVNKDNIYGFQPHPEKSHNIGLQILKNFATS